MYSVISAIRQDTRTPKQLIFTWAVQLCLLHPLLEENEKRPCTRCNYFQDFEQMKHRKLNCPHENQLFPLVAHSWFGGAELGPYFMLETSDGNIVQSDVKPLTFACYVIACVIMFETSAPKHLIACLYPK